MSLASSKSVAEREIDWLGENSRWKLMEAEVHSVHFAVVEYVSNFSRDPRVNLELYGYVIVLS